MAGDRIHSRRRTVLVVVDDSERSRRALIDAAVEFSGDEVVVLYVLESFVVKSVTESAVWDDEHADRREREAERLLEEHRKLAETYGTDVRTVLSRGSPNEAITEAIETFGVDHVVVGHPKRTGLSRLVPGRLAETVLGGGLLR
ncbi:universal stress protein [Natronorubrum sp. FCH18a]|uniref:universal stress protein n=1 Tax=Natronorubrum sp. FCH18a TaxID=3447018 RepID=UPI003F5197AB